MDACMCGHISFRFNRIPFAFIPEKGKNISGGKKGLINYAFEACLI